MRPPPRAVGLTDCAGHSTDRGRSQGPPSDAPDRGRCRGVLRSPMRMGTELPRFRSFAHRQEAPDAAIRLSTRITAPEAFSPSDRKSTRLNSSHLVISYAVFC